MVLAPKEWERLRDSAWIASAKRGAPVFVLERRLRALKPGFQRGSVFVCGSHHISCSFGVA